MWIVLYDFCHFYSFNFIIVFIFSWINTLSLCNYNSFVIHFYYFYNLFLELVYKQITYRIIIHVILVGLMPLWCHMYTKAILFPPFNFYDFKKCIYLNDTLICIVLTFASAVILHTKWEKTSNETSLCFTLYSDVFIMIYIHYLSMWTSVIIFIRYPFIYDQKNSLYFLHSWWQFFY